MRELQLTNSNKVALVDDEYYDYFNQWDWYICNGYVMRTTGKGILLHREVLRRAGHVDFGVGDHRNRLPLDNRKENLRPATPSQNAQNRGITSNNTSGYIGVWRQFGKLSARAELNGTKTSLGTFDVDKHKQAGQAADVGRIWFHDADFVVLNFERSDYPPGHPSTWPPGPYSDVIRRCRRQPICNGILGYWNVRWHTPRKGWVARIKTNGKLIHLGIFKDSLPNKHTALLDAVKVADIAAIHLGRDKINLGRDHYPPGPPRDWPEDAIPDCPALRRLIA
jgi:hypothetical protein